MDMRKWVADCIASDTKKALPVVSFPGIQLMGITVNDLIASGENQAKAMRMVADRNDSSASVAFMDLSVEAEAFGSKIVFSDDEVPTVVGKVIDEDADPDEIKVPKVGDARTGSYIKAIEIASKEITDRPVFAGCIGPFSLTGRLMDVSEVMILCYEEPELVHAVLDKTTSFIIDYINAFKEAGADGIFVAEPLAGLLSPDLAAEFSDAYCKRIVDAVQDDEFLFFYHNCGGGVIQSINTIIETGALGFHFGNAIEMKDVLPLMPDNVLVAGNIDPAGEIRNGTPESVYKSTTALLEECSSYPNFVISTGCDVPPMSPWENIDAFYKATEDFYL